MQGSTAIATAKIPLINLTHFKNILVIYLLLFYFGFFIMKILNSLFESKYFRRDFLNFIP